MKETISLFKSVLITSVKSRKTPKEVLQYTLERGFVFSPEVVGEYSDRELLVIAKLVEEVVGLSKEKANASFHKSWSKVAKAPIQQLVLEQLMHYITTYGFESLGVYSSSSVYIPSEKLQIPELSEGINLTVIRGLTKSALKEKLLSLLSVGVALSEQSVKDVTTLAVLTEFSEDDLVLVNNREVKVVLCKNLGLVPSNPVEFLRLIVYITTNSSLIIKDKATISKVGSRDNSDVYTYFKRFEKNYGLEKLAEVYNRFKPIFLALKTDVKLSRVVNKINKLSKKLHKPLVEDYLNTVTAKLSQGKSIKVSELDKELLKVNTFRKSRLAYALKFRTTEANSILYRLRNGKSYATDFKFNNKFGVSKVLDCVLSSIVKDLEKNVKGKKVYIPENVTYTLPSSEKQFVGSIPAGSFVTVPQNLVFGVHWMDKSSVNLDSWRDNGRVDLDLSTISLNGKIGWDRNYRSESGDVLFSGDLTAAPAPNGASELFFIKKQIEDAFLVCLNYFNYSEGLSCDFKILIASEPVKLLKENFMVHPDNVKAVVVSKIDKPQNIIGLVITNTKECKYYFIQTAIGKSITSGNNKFTLKAKDYLFNYYKNTIELNELLVKAGAKLVKDKVDAELDLSLENLQKDTIINLLK